MGHWREVLTEQLSLLAKAKFPGTVHIGFLGDEYEDGFIYHVAHTLGLSIEVRHFGSNLQEFEIPTQRWMQQKCASLDPETPVLYFHTKGVSNPSWISTMWRWLMNAWCLTKWERMVQSLSMGHNCAGVSWSRGGFPAPYFPGNFWWTTAGFVNQLTPIDDYVIQFVDCITHCNPHSLGYRHAAEVWVNSRLNANPCVFGPYDALLCDHAWWISGRSSVWRAAAISLGSSTAAVCGARRPANFVEAFAGESHLWCSFGSDKTTVHDYSKMYDTELSKFRDSACSLLEIGVFSGCSLAGWRRFLGAEAKILGLDITTDSVIFKGEEILVCDATNPEAVAALDCRGNWDIVIDDGSHLIDDQVKTFDLLWPKLNSGGVYVIEDIWDLDVFKSRFPDAVIYDTRVTSSRWDDLCAVFRKP